jgi:hypothetical protein
MHTSPRKPAVECASLVIYVNGCLISTSATDLPRFSKPTTTLEEPVSAAPPFQHLSGLFSATMGFLFNQFSVTPRYPTGDFDGKNIVITDSDNGRGREAARHHAHFGASKLILGAHSLEKGEVAR